MYFCDYPIGNSSLQGRRIEGEPYQTPNKLGSSVFGNARSSENGSDNSEATERTDEGP